MTYNQTEQLHTTKPDHLIAAILTDTNYDLQSFKAALFNLPNAQAHAQANCKDLGYPIARSVTVDYSRWYYSADQDSGANYQFQASLERPYTATCYKRVRRNP